MNKYTGTKLTPSTREFFADRARAVQNHPATANIDIVSFLYFDGVTEDEAERHVAYYEARVAA